MPSPKCLESRDSYTVGWIAALPSERAAAIAMLDEKHGKPTDFEQPITDPNSYSWGRIHEHNVVIASLAAGLYGTSSAAATALPMLSSFPQIRVGMMVGIGAGIPSLEKDIDIRLGDVVVSQPAGRSGGVVQYDLGKASLAGKWERKDFLSKPPEVLLRALSNLQTSHILDGTRITEFLSDAVERNPRLVKAGFVHPGFNNDRLFEATYAHLDGKDCCNCDLAKQISRSPRELIDPEIHYGTIASGNTLVKDAITRDKIIKDLVKEDCLCIEMEAAGLMNNFPCLVIRGVCDYADSHKQDKWQQYAAATAAAFAKELLDYVPHREIEKTPKAIEVLKQIVETIHVNVKQTRAALEQEHQASQTKRIMDWLSPVDPSTNFNSAQEKHHSGTGSWFFKHRSFVDWKARQSGILWLHGIPGSGKTVLSSTIITHLRMNQDDPTKCVLNFFFDFNDSRKQTLESLVRSLLGQLYCSSNEQHRTELDALYSEHQDGRSTPSTATLVQALQRTISNESKLSIVIDALDECQTKLEVLRWMRDICTLDAAILVTSRQEVDIETYFRMSINNLNIIPLQEAAVNRDIQDYVHAVLRADDKGFKRWHSRLAVLEEIETELTKKACGMFRWVFCQLQELQHCLDIRTLHDALCDLPKTLDETYERILAKIPERRLPDTIKILQFITYSETPLRLVEITQAIAVRPNETPSFERDWTLPDPREIVQYCPGLVTVSKLKSKSYKRNHRSKRHIQLAHLSVKEYLVSERVEARFRNSMLELHARAAITRVCIAFVNHAAESIKSKKVVKANSRVDELDIDTGREAGSDITEPDEQDSDQYEDSSGDDYGDDDEDSDDYEDSNDDEDSDHDEDSGIEFDNDLYRNDYHDYVDGLIKTKYPFLKYAAGFWMKNAEQALTDSEQMGEDVCNFLLKQREALRLTMQIRHDWEEYLDAPLCYVAEAGCYNLTRLLLKHGKDPNAETFDGTSLQTAVRRDRRGVIRLFLAHGVHLDTRGGLDCLNALQAASYNGHESIARLLLDWGAEVNAQGGHYGNALQAASCRGHESIARLLLKRGADVNAQGGHYGSALRAALVNKRKSVSVLLLDSGAIVNTGRLLGQLLCMAYTQGRRNFLPMPINKKAGINPKDEYGWNLALVAAIYSGSEKRVERFLAYGADVHSRDLGASPMEIARQKRHLSDKQLRIYLKIAMWQGMLDSALETLYRQRLISVDNTPANTGIEANPNLMNEICADEAESIEGDWEETTDLEEEIAHSNTRTNMNPVVDNETHQRRDSWPFWSSSSQQSSDYITVVVEERSVNELVSEEVSNRPSRQYRIIPARPRATWKGNWRSIKRGRRFGKSAEVRLVLGATDDIGVGAPFFIRIPEPEMVMVPGVRKRRQGRKGPRVLREYRGCVSHIY